MPTSPDPEIRQQRGDALRQERKTTPQPVEPTTLLSTDAEDDAEFEAWLSERILNDGWEVRRD